MDEGPPSLSGEAPVVAFQGGQRCRPVAESDVGDPIAGGGLEQPEAHKQRGFGHEEGEGEGEVL